MSDETDIYAELLGIPPAGRPMDFYRLLGVAPFEADPPRINAATKRQLARLSPLLNGARAEQAKQLIAEIATARAALTTPKVKERYDAKLRESGTRWYTVVPEGPASGSVPPAYVDPALVKETRTWPSAEPVVSEPEPDSDRPLRWAHQVAAPPPLPDLPVDAPTVTKARLISGPGTVFSAEPTPSIQPPQPTMFAAATPLADQAPATPWPHETMLPTPPGSGAPIGAHAYAAVRRPPARRDSSQIALIVALVCIVGLVAVFGGAALTWQSSGPRVAQSDEGATSKSQDRGLDGPSADGGGRDDRTSGTSAAASATTRAQKLDDARSEPQAAKTNRLVDHASAIGSPTKEIATPIAANEPAAMPEDASRAEPVRRSIKAARQALAARDLAAAEEQLDLALVDASSDALRARVDGTKALHHYVERFWNAVRQSAKTLDSGHEFDVDGQVVIVVEISRDKKKLVLRSKGQNRDYAIEQLPADVAVGLAERWLAKDDANSKVFVGTFLAVDAQGNPQRGRRLLAEAKAAGSDAATAVLAELDR